MGRARQPGEARQGSPRFAEMVVNTPKSLSIAAALHPDVSDALDAAQRDAVAEIRSWLGQHSVTRVGPRGRQEVVPVERLQTVAISHRTSRAGDPHRHIHLQIGTRVWAGGAWRGLDTAALFRQQGAIRALGTAVLAAHPRLAAVLDAHGLTLDPVTGEVAELQPFNAVMSKRAAQVTPQPGGVRGAVGGRPPRPGAGPGGQRAAAGQGLGPRAAAQEADAAGQRGRLAARAGRGRLHPRPAPRARTRPVALDELRVQRLASRALDRCAAGGSTWTVHDIAEHVTRIITESGVRAERGELRDVIAMTTRLAAEDCFSVLPPGTARPEHVAHLTTVRVMEVDTQLRDLLAARAAQPSSGVPDVQVIARDRGLDDEQARAAAAVASRDPLVVVEGAAGAGKTTMLGVAIQAAQAEGRASRVVTPTKKAADVAARELGVPADSVAKLVHDHGWRWNSDGVWTRLAVGEVDPGTGRIYTGPPASARLRDGERVVVDEAGMLDQDTAVALLQIADEAGASLALVGDRAQLPAVGRGGVLDIAAQVSRHTVDMATVHRFTDPEYADLTVQMRRGENPSALFDRLHALGLVVLHPSAEDAHTAIARSARDGDAVTTATNDEARVLNASIREVRVRRGEVDDARTTFGNDGLPIGAGDVIQTRSNASRLGVANRQVWTVQQVTEDGGVWAREAAAGRAHPRNVRLPADYVTAHTHLAYAATTYGVQSATTPASHTVLSDALDGAGMYVGMTRGRQQNTVHVVAADLDDAREQFAAALQRDRADRGLATAARAAREAVAGLVPDGPVTFVNAERARLRGVIRTAEPEAARWETARDELDRLGASHRIEHDADTRALADAEAALPRVRAQVIAPLTVQATADGARCLQAARTAGQAYDALQRSGRFGRRAAQRSYSAAHQARLETESATSRRWGGMPFGGGNLDAWATAVAEHRAEADPRVGQAREIAARAAQRLHDLTTRHGESLVALVPRGRRRAVTPQHPGPRRALARHHRRSLANSRRDRDPARERGCRTHPRPRDTSRGREGSGSRSPGTSRRAQPSALTGPRVPVQPLPRLRAQPVGEPWTTPDKIAL